MSKQPQRKLQLDLQFDVSAFTSGIHKNFETIWQFMQEQANDIQSLRKKIETMDSSRKSSESEHVMHKNESQQVSLVYSDKSWKSLKVNPQIAMSEKQYDNNASNTLEQRDIENKQLNNKEFSGGNTQTENYEQLPEREQQPEQQYEEGGEKNHAQASKVHENSQKGNNKQKTKKRKIKLQSQVGEEKNKDIQKSLTETQLATKITVTQNPQELTLIENKIFELNERLDKLQLSSVKENGNFARKIGQLQSQIEKNLQIGGKRQKQFKKIEHDVSSFRTELAGYKLKKEAQLMRLTGKAGEGKGQSSDYILSKIQELALHAQETVTREQFQIFGQQLEQQHDVMLKKINEAVTGEQFNEVVTLLTKQIKKGRRRNKEKDQQEKQQGKQTENEDGDQDIVDIQLLLKVKEIQKALKNLHELVVEEKSIRKQGEKGLSNKIFEQGKELMDLKVQVGKDEFQIGQHQDFMKQMNSSYNSKFKEVEEQIIETQESIQKLNSQMKFYNYTANSQTAASVVSGSSGILSVEQGKIAGIEADINALKKKVSKFSIKIQSLKDEMTAFKNDLLSELEGVKLQVDKKADWEGLKKGFGYFEDKIKEVYSLVVNVQSNMDLENKDDSMTTAAKRGWTCLCCDKDIKKFEGKLSQAKFTSIFPARYESPRIGGYYKRKDNEKQYKQLFLPKGGNRRLSHNLPAFNESKVDT